MNDNMINQSAANDPDILDYFITEVRKALPQSPVDLVTDYASVFASGVWEFVKHNSGKLSYGMKFGGSFMVNGKLVPLNIVLDVNQDGLLKSVAKNFVGCAAGKMAGYGAGMAIGVVLGGGPLAVGIATVAVGYFASEWVTNTVGEAWDYHIGPKVSVEYDEIKKSLIVTTNGKLSDTIRNYWDGVKVGDGEMKLFDQNRWIVKALDSQKEALKIDYYRDENTYTFSGTPAETLHDLYRNSMPDHKVTVDEILVISQEDFLVSIGGERELIYNMVPKTQENFQSDIMRDNVFMWAAQELKPYVLEKTDMAEYIKPSNDPSNFSKQYKLDRARFHYYQFHPYETVPEEEGVSILFEDKRLGAKTFVQKEGVSIDTEIRDYWWGTDGSDKFEGINGDDHLSRKIHEDPKWVFSL